MPFVGNFNAVEIGGRRGDTVLVTGTSTDTLTAERIVIVLPTPGVEHRAELAPEDITDQPWTATFPGAAEHYAGRKQTLVIGIATLKQPTALPNPFVWYETLPIVDENAQAVPPIDPGEVPVDVIDGVGDDPVA